MCPLTQSGLCSPYTHRPAAFLASAATSTHLLSAPLFPPEECALTFQIHSSALFTLLHSHAHCHSGICRNCTYVSIAPPAFSIYFFFRDKVSLQLASAPMASGAIALTCPATFCPIGTCNHMPNTSLASAGTCTPMHFVPLASEGALAHIPKVTTGLCKHLQTNAYSHL